MSGGFARAAVHTIECGARERILQQIHQVRHKPKLPPAMAGGGQRIGYRRFAADWRAMKLSKPFSATRNHSTSSARKAM